MASQYDKKRPKISESLKRVIAIESGHACAIKDCIEHTYNEYHHIDGNRENNNPDNLIYLCDKHHKMAHKGIIDKESLRQYKKINQDDNVNCIIEESNNKSSVNFEINIPALRHMDVLMDRVFFTQQEMGIKLYELWSLRNKKYSLCEFCRLLGIEENDIESYFTGKKSLQLHTMQLITKFFDLDKSYFFEGTYWLQKAYWKSDIVKYSILSMVTPKSNIEKITNQGKFYGGIFIDLAQNICCFYEELYCKNSTQISDDFKRKLEIRYYKVLEQYPVFDGDRKNTNSEKILRSWFFAIGSYISRIVVESISHIDISNIDHPIIFYKFNESLENKNFLFEWYNGDSLTMDVGK